MDHIIIGATCFLLMCGCSGQVEKLVAPINEAIIATGNVEFRCRVQQNAGLTSYITWGECITRRRSDGCLTISTDENMEYVARVGSPVRAERYSISNGSTGEYNLNIAGVVLTKDAGSYVCRADNNAAFLGYAELIILDGAPRCSRNTTNPDQAIQGEYIRHVCEAPYRGRWAPIMTWDEAGIPINDIKDDSESYVARYSITYKVTPQHNGNIYGARTFFQTPTDTTDNEATNPPSYSYNFQFEPLTVFFGPYKLTIDWDEGCMGVGTHVTCNALGNPAPTYRWIDVNTTDTFSNDKTLTLTEEMLGFQIYKCVAGNVYGEAEDIVNIQLCTSTSIPINNDSPRHTLPLCSGSGIAIAVVVNVLSVSLAVGVTVYITRRDCPGTIHKAGRSEKIHFNTSEGTQGGNTNEPTIYHNQGRRPSTNTCGGLVTATEYERVEQRGVVGTANADYVNTPNIDSARNTERQYEDMRDMVDGSGAIPGIGEYLSTHADSGHLDIEVPRDQKRHYEPLAAPSVEDAEAIERQNTAEYEALNI